MGNRYLLWDIKVEKSKSSNALAVRVIADTEKAALEKVRQILPHRMFYEVIGVCEYWLPTLSSEILASEIGKLK